MRSARLIAVSLTVAGALGGCSVGTTGSSGGFTGTAAAVDSAVTTFGSDASASNSSAICSSVITSALRSTLNRAGGCTQIISNQLGTITDFTLTVKAIQLHGKTALVRVTSTRAGKSTRSVLTLVREHGSWRVAKLG